MIMKICNLKNRQECSVLKLGEIERRIRRAGRALYQCYDVNLQTKKAWHVAYESTPRSIAKQAQNVRSIFFGHFEILKPRAIGKYQSKENRKIELRLFWNKSKKYQRPAFVVIPGGKAINE
jgi:hypothetical protein